MKIPSAFIAAPRARRALHHLRVLRARHHVEPGHHFVVLEQIQVRNEIIFQDTLMGPIDAERHHQRGGGARTGESDFESAQRKELRELLGDAIGKRARRVGPLEERSGEVGRGRRRSRERFQCGERALELGELGAAARAAGEMDRDAALFLWRERTVEERRELALDVAGSAQDASSFAVGAKDPSARRRSRWPDG